jgi:hypothetical protein
MKTERYRNSIKIAVWTVFVAFALFMLPAIVSLMWVPHCSNCHETQEEKLAESVHSKQDCRSCHQGEGLGRKIAFDQHVMYSMVLNLMPQRTSTRAVQNDSCLSCHQQEVGKGVISNEGLRIAHEACAEGIRCNSCHGGIGHPESTVWQSRYAMDTCLACHEKNSDVALTKCETCHDGRMRRSRSSTSTFAVVHGSDWEQSHGAGDWNTCSPCHTSSLCAKCHGSLVPHTSQIIFQHSAIARDPQNKCRTCHRSQTFCDGCHGMEMPHPGGFLKAHSQVVRDKGEDACLKCHARMDCNGCHTGHVHPGGPNLWN